MREAAPLGEATLYRPVKHFLESCGYQVKGEVRGCDLVARRGDEPPLIVELKLRFTLTLVLQGIDRLAITDRVYLAVPRRRAPRAACRPKRGGAPPVPPPRLGLILVGRRGDTVAIIEEPVPYRPRRAAARTAQLLSEFARRTGDGNIGGRNRTPIVNRVPRGRAALRPGPGVGCEEPDAAGRIAHRYRGCDAAAILQRNVYGWFARSDAAAMPCRPPGIRRSASLPTRSRCSLRRPPSGSPSDGRPFRRRASAAADRRLFRRRGTAAPVAPHHGLRRAGLCRRFRPRAAALPHPGLVRPNFGAFAADEPQVTEQSSMDLMYPAHLVFHYERLMSLAFALCERPVTALLLGVGGVAMWRFLRAYLPECAPVLVDSDQAIVAIARRWFYLSQPVMVETASAISPPIPSVSM